MKISLRFLGALVLPVAVMTTGQPLQGRAAWAGDPDPTSRLRLAGFTSPNGSTSQTGTVAGQVTEEATGRPIIGSMVQIVGTDLGRLTDAEGRYTIDEVPVGEIEVRAQRIGYSTIVQTITLQENETATIDFELRPEALALDEVVVTGFGTQMREGLTGNIARVDRRSLDRVSWTAVEEAIQARAAGVFIESGSGKVGQGIRTLIRGPASVTASNQPLYVVDGVPVTSQSQTTMDGEPTNPMADLNINDIESIDVLKDASAAAIYGSRASNGVVVITTRQGAASEAPQFTIDYTHGWSRPTNSVGFLNADEYREFYLEAAENVGRDESFLAERVPFWDNPIDTNWEEAIWRGDAGLSQLNASLRGGSQDTRYFVALGYTDETGILVRNAFERFSGRLNLGQRVSDDIEVGMNLSLSRTANDRVSNDRAFSTPMQFVAQAPTSPIRDPATGEINTNTLYDNGMLDAEHNTSEMQVFRNLGNAYLNYDLLDGLSFRSELGVDLLNQKEESFATSLTTAGGSGTFRTVNLLNYNTNSYFTYQPSLPGVHDLQVVTGMSYQRATREISSVSGTDFPSDRFQKIASAANITDASTTGTGYSYLSYFARANYDYDGRYLASLSGRIDGSSRFGTDNRYGFFPAASAGWIVSSEDFFDAGAISFLKLRASYGLTGNSEIDDFAATGLFVGADYVGQPGIRPSQLQNPDLKWETTRQLDVGLEVALFDGRISAELDYYNKNTTDLLLAMNVPGSSGFETVMQNVGEMTNRGVELLVNSNNLIGEFGWSTSFNIAVNRNRVSDLAGQVIDTGAGTGDERRPNVAMEGEPLGVFFAAKYAGVDPQTGDALFYKAAGSDETTSDFGEAERQVIGDPNPDFQGGLTNDFTWRNFDLSATLQFVYGRDAFAGSGIFFSSNGRFTDNQTRDQLNRWRQQGDITDVPQARLSQNNGGQISSRYLYDASFLRLRTVNLSYSLPRSMLQRLAGIQTARVFIRGSNLLTFTGYPLWDPEVNTSVVDNVSIGNDFYTAPQPRTIAVGFNVGF